MKWISDIINKLNITSSSSKKQKEFGYLLLALITLLYGFFIFKNGFEFNSLTYKVIAVFIIILIITFVYEKIFKPFLFLWLLIGDIIGVITSTIIMSIIYFLIFSPIVLILKCFKKEEIYKPEWKTVSRTLDYSKLS